LKRSLILRRILGTFFFLLAQGHAADLSSGRGDFGGKLDAGDSLYLGELAAASRLANRKIIILSHSVSLSPHTILSGLSIYSNLFLYIPIMQESLILNQIKYKLCAPYMPLSSLKMPVQLKKYCVCIAIF
jgi:hypothetical protein